jgi:hypothetical protein
MNKKIFTVATKQEKNYLKVNFNENTIQIFKEVRNLQYLQQLQTTDKEH